MDYLKRNDQAPLKTSSNRAFGLVFAAVFAIVAVWPLFFGGSLRLWAAAVALLFAITALALPQTLAPLNRLWTRFGLLLHKIVNPLILGFIFFLTVVPTGLLLRLFGKDPLRLKRDPHRESYWLPRDPPGPRRNTMNRQF